MNFDLYGEKIAEENAITIAQRHNANEVQAKFNRILESKRAVWCAKIEAEMLGVLSESELVHASIISARAQ
jgi:hypothetical protein